MKYEGKYSKYFSNKDFYFQARPFQLDYFLSTESPSPWKGLHGMGESVREREKRVYIFLI
jgi:hypothetical protein